MGRGLDQVPSSWHTTSGWPSNMKLEWHLTSKTSPAVKGATLVTSPCSGAVGMSHFTSAANEEDNL